MRDGDAEADPMYDQAVAIVLQNRRASISLVQRHLRIGYNRAARLLEQMESAGLVSADGEQRQPRHPGAQARRMSQLLVARRCCSPLPRMPTASICCATSLANVKSGRAAFTQTVTSVDGAKKKDSSGQFEFVRPNRFRFSYAKPFEQQIVADGQKVWLYDVDLNQVTVRPIAQALGATPAALLAGGTLDKEFELKALPASDGSNGCRPQPRVKDGPIQSLRVGFNGRRWRRSRSSTRSASARCCVSRRWSKAASWRTMSSASRRPRAPT